MYGSPYALMSRFHLLLSLLLILGLPCAAASSAQMPSPLAVRLEGLRSVNHQGSFRAAAYLPDGTLVLLLDEGDGLRLLKTDADASQLLGEVHLGGSGDSGIALAMDRTGNVFVAGTAWSGALTGTPGAAFPSPADTSQNSFVAGFDSTLQLRFLTFLEAGSTGVSSLAVTDGGAFVTGVSYGASFPVTTPSPSATPCSTGCAFVQQYTPDGSRLLYSTLLGPADGATTPASIAADARGAAYVVGSTSSPDFPQIQALQLFQSNDVSGFVSKLQPQIGVLAFSSRVAGSGLASIALTPGQDQLLITGSVSPGSFPLANATEPIVDLPYQSLLRLSADGQTLVDSLLLLPGSTSAVTPGITGDAWITGSLTAPLQPSLETIGPGDTYLLHITSADQIDQQLRFGGQAANSARYASIATALAAPALNSSGRRISLAGSITVTTDAALRPTQIYSLGLNNKNSTLLPSGVQELLPSACDGTMACAGSAGILVQVEPSAQGALTVDAGDLPSVTVRNSSGTPVTALTASTTGSVEAFSNCPATLAPWAQCGIVLPQQGNEVLQLHSADTPTVTLSVPASSSDALLAFSTAEVNFGVVSAEDDPATRSVQVTNPGSVTANFASSAELSLSSAFYTLSETGGTCAGTASAHSLAAGASCTLTLALKSTAALQQGELVRAAWEIGTRSIPVFGFLAPAALSTSSPYIDFGIQPTGPLGLVPRFLYLSNHSETALPHLPASLPAGGPFSIGDDCPALLQPHSVCSMEIGYAPGATPSFDSQNLLIDNSLSVSLRGQSLGQPASIAAVPSAAPLLITPGAVLFSSAVTVSTISTEVQRVEVRNSGPDPLPLQATVLGDFLLQSGCTATLLPNAACTLLVQFAPSQPGTREGLLTLSTASGTFLSTVFLQGTGISLFPEDIGDIDLGQTPVAEPTVTWFHLTTSVPTLSASVQGPGLMVAFQADAGSGHGTLPEAAFRTAITAPCISCWLAVRFAPQALGTTTGVLQLLSTADAHAEQRTVHATAIASSGLFLTPTTLVFPATPQGSSSLPQAVALVDLLPGTHAIQIQSITAEGDFQLSPRSVPVDCAQDLVPTSSCRMQITFQPTAQKLRSGTLTVVTDRGTLHTALQGTGTPPTGLSFQPTTLRLPSSGTPAVLTLSNTSGTPLALGPFNPTDSAFHIDTACGLLAPGASCTASVTATAAPATSGLAGLLIPAMSIDSNGQQLTSVYTVPLAISSGAFGVGVNIFPAFLAFAPSPVHTLGQLRQVIITNTGNQTETIRLTTPQSFPLASPSGCQTLAAGASCVVNLVFAPETAGLLQATLLVTATASDGTATAQSAVSLTGFGTTAGALTFSEGSSASQPLTFGNTASGQTLSQDLFLTNTGGAAVSLRGVSTTAPFTATTDCTQTLTPGDHCKVSVAYAPVYTLPADAVQVAREDAGTLRIESDAAPNPQTVFLLGSVTPTAGQVAAAGSLPTYSLSQGSLTFANTASGEVSAEQDLTLSNNGTVPVTIAGLLTPPEFAASTGCQLLEPGTTCTVQVTFTPGASTLPIVLQSLRILSSGADRLQSVTLLGSSVANPLGVSSTALDFGKVPLGTSAQRSLVLTNNTMLPLNVGQLGATGDYALSPGSCGPANASLGAGESCIVNVLFTPAARGLRLGTATITYGGGGALTVSLSGTGLAGMLTATPLSLRFDAVALHRSATLPIRLTNTGDAPLSGLLLAIAGPNAAEFAPASGCPVSPSTLAPGDTCQVQIAFSPSLLGTSFATLGITSAGEDAPLTIPLEGAGVLPPGMLLSMAPDSPGAQTIFHGSTAAFDLLLNGQGGFSGPVQLQCQPATPVPHATCTVSPVQAILGGDAAIPIAVQITSRTEVTQAAEIAPTALLLFLPGAVLAFTRRSRRSKPLLLISLVLALSSLSGCGGGYATASQTDAAPGIYHFQVTATAADSPAVTSGLTLQLTVR